MFNKQVLLEKRKLLVMKIEQYLWAKTNPFKSLFCHMRDTAIVTNVILTNSVFSNLLSQLTKWLGLTTNNETLNFCMYLSGLHDIGKCHPAFQISATNEKITEILSEKQELKYPFTVNDYRHEMGSRDAVKRIWSKNDLFPHHANEFSEVLALHHQGKNGKSRPITVGEDWPEAIFWLKLQDDIEAKLRKWLVPPQINNVEHIDNACLILSCLIILSDWISSSSYFENTAEDMSENDVRDLAINFIDKIGLSDVPKIASDTFSDTWQTISPHNMRPIQETIDKYFSSDNPVPQLIIIEAPMGEGKTEAGIYAALKMAEHWNKSGFYVGLPTAATANQMVSRINDLLDSHGIDNARLLHGSAWLNTEINTNLDDESDRNAVESWLMSTKRSLLSPFAVGTIDQALLSVMKTKYGIIRLLGLTNKVLIIDEIHAYDAYMSSVISKLLKWCRSLSVPVVMLSATLPQKKKEEYLKEYNKNVANISTKYPLITMAFANEIIQQIPIKDTFKHFDINVNMVDIFDDYDAIASLAINKIENGGCECVIVNDVTKAQSIYQTIKKQCPSETKLLLFHSRFAAGRRQQIEKECISLFGPNHKKRPTKAILVATQVVEQSLDLDFDVMLTDIAPIDLILQRVGRLHRHTTTSRPLELQKASLTVFTSSNNEYGATSYLYYNYFLNRTAKLLNDKPTISIPYDVPKMVNSVYSEAPTPQEIENFIEQQISDRLKAGQASLYELSDPRKDCFNISADDFIYKDEASRDSYLIAKTRLTTDTIQIAIVPQLLYKKIDELTQSKSPIPAAISKDVLQYSVSIPFKYLQPFFSVISDNTIDGYGKLHGTKICSADNLPSTPYETLIAFFGNKEIVYDKDIGLQIISHKY